MNQNELNDLYDYGYKIYQNQNYFKFSLDSILLADFIKINYKDHRLLDLCTGNAPLPIILSSKIKEIYAFELQKEIYELAKTSLDLNNIQNVKLINDDIKNYSTYLQEKIDIVTCNPPYFKYTEESLINQNMIKSIARHEIKITLEEIIKISSNILKDKGKFYIVYRTERLIELVHLLKKYNFGIKEIQCCYNNPSSDCSIILISATKNGKDNIKILKPLYTNNYRR